MTQIRKKAATGLAVGDHFRIRRTFTAEDVAAFADITRDYNPVHFDRRFAAVKNFDNLIFHGLLVAAMLSEIGGQIGWLASEMGFSFLRPTYIGETVTCDFTIVDIDDRNRARAEVEYRNQEGRVIMTAHLKGILPGDAEKRILAENTRS